MEEEPTPVPSAISVSSAGVGRLDDQMKVIGHEAILDKNGKELWSLKLPAPINNPGIILHEVQIDLLTEREFGQFCQKTWTRGPSATPNSSA